MRVWGLASGEGRDVQTEDAGRTVAPLRVLVLYLGGVLTHVQLPRHK